MVLGDLLSTHLNFIRNVLGHPIRYKVLSFRYCYTRNGRIQFSLNSLNPSVFVVETKKEFKMYLSSAKSGHV